MADTPEESQSRPSQATIERLAIAVELASKRPWVLIWRSFLQGFMTALGATIGAALFFTFLLWLFHHLGGIDLLKPQIEKLQNLIIPEKYQKQVDADIQTGYQSLLSDHQLTLR